MRNFHKDTRKGVRKQKKIIIQKTLYYVVCRELLDKTACFTRRFSLFCSVNQSVLSGHL